MPIYEYECKNCGQRFDKLQPMAADPLTECELCGKGPVRRVPHSAGVIFKGSGWYATDNRKGGSSGSSSSSSIGEGGNGGGDSSKSDSSKSKNSSSSDGSSKSASESKSSAESSKSTSAGE